MDDSTEYDEPTADDALDCAEEFARSMIRLSQDNGDLHTQIETAERYLVLIKSATTLEQAQRAVRQYFGEESPF